MLAFMFPVEELSDISALPKIGEAPKEPVVLGRLIR